MFLELYAQNSQEGVDYVDLGLTSGTLWATRNVGASRVDDYGGYYAWGETEEKEKYYWSTYFDSVGGSSSNFNLFSKDARTSIVGSEYDAATTVMGYQWKMPTLSQWQELKDECRWSPLQLPQEGEDTTEEVKGWMLTGPNGNTIFIPCAGSKYGTETLYQGKYLYYWTGELYCMYDKTAGSNLGCYMDDSFVNTFSYYGISRYYGYPIRAVFDPNAKNPETTGVIMIKEPCVTTQRDGKYLHDGRIMIVKNASVFGISGSLNLGISGQLK